MHNGSLVYLVDSNFTVEKMKLATQIRLSHLKKKNRKDDEAEELMKRAKGLEDYVQSRISFYLEQHPAFYWFSLVKGVGRENIAKVVGLCRVAPEKDPEGKELPYARSISGLWKFCGYSVEDGKAPKRQAGQKLSYNSQLRSMCWRLGSSLLKAKGKFYAYYLAQKETYQERYRNSGVEIVPAAQLPKLKKKKTETDKLISEGHVHNQALRKMIKLFLACLWLTWREGAGLSISKPYAIDKLKHSSFIDPWKMVDRAKMREKPTKKKRAIVEEKTTIMERANT